MNIMNLIIINIGNKTNQQKQQQMFSTTNINSMSESKPASNADMVR